MTFQIGQRVQVPVGSTTKIGFVVTIESCRDRILTMNQSDAREFIGTLKRQYGETWKTSWCMLGVRLDDGTIHHVLGRLSKLTDDFLNTIER